MLGERGIWVGNLTQFYQSSECSIERKKRKTCAAPRNIGEDFPPRDSHLLTYVTRSYCHFETTTEPTSFLLHLKSLAQNLSFRLALSLSDIATCNVVWSDVSKNSQTTTRNAVSFLSFLSLYFTHSSHLVSSFEIYVNSTNNQPQTSSSSSFQSFI